MSYYYRRGERHKRKATVRYLVCCGEEGKLVTIDPRRKRNFIIKEVILVGPVSRYTIRKVKNIDYVVRIKSNAVSN